ncbi:MAG: hypothetical protein KatS3mg128_0438 [Silanimonas sp.]|nr:MAG: hypothetical protein KatS3mg127_1726 [Silanimonas sp.]GIX39389.1 MAG: hypothetical protein KatS3mg128_0438 [Silanimonas sp.]
MKTDDLIALLARQPDALPHTNPRRDGWLAGLVGLGAALALMLTVLGPRPDLGAAVAAPLFGQKVGALGLLALVGSAVAIRAGLPGRAASAIEHARWLAPGWLAIATLLTVLATPHGARAALFTSPTILVCLTAIPLLSALPAVGFVWALRRAAPTNPRRAARAVGLAAGSLGAFAYAFHCQADQPGYVLLWYGLAIAITVAASEAIASRWLRW